MRIVSLTLKENLERNGVLSVVQDYGKERVYGRKQDQSI